MKKSLISEANTTPLIYAINKKDRQLINYLLSQDGIDINAANNPIVDQNPLQVSIKLNDIETLIHLVEKGVNKSIRLRGVLPIELALEIRLNLLNSSSTHTSASITQLTAATTTTSSISPTTKTTIPTTATTRREVTSEVTTRQETTEDAISTQNINNDNNVSQSATMAVTGVDIIALKENQMIIELLATSPNDVHIQNEKGECPFDFVVKHRMIDIIEHFLSVQGKLFDRENRNGKSPIDYATDVEYRKYLLKKFKRQYREHLKQQNNNASNTRRHSLHQFERNSAKQSNEMDQINCDYDDDDDEKDNGDESGESGDDEDNSIERKQRKGKSKKDRSKDSEEYDDNRDVIIERAMSEDLNLGDSFEKENSSPESKKKQSSNQKHQSNNQRHRQTQHHQQQQNDNLNKAFSSDTKIRYLDFLF